MPRLRDQLNAIASVKEANAMLQFHGDKIGQPAQVRIMHCVERWLTADSFCASGRLKHGIIHVTHHRCEIQYL